MCVLTLLTVAYLAVAIPYAWGKSRNEKLSGLKIELTDPTSVFVTVPDIALECGIDPDTLPQCLRRTFPLLALKERLERSDKIENVHVNILTDGTVRVIATPMIPVARVFDSGDHSYYINREGKQISAQIRYRLDVPIVTGTFPNEYPAKRLVPLLEYIAGHPETDAVVAGIHQEADGNIIIVPSIVGHVVNFGDTSMVDNKFRRLHTFYHRVFPAMGWEYYDTVAVKWRGSIFATRSNKSITPPPLPIEEEINGLWDENDIEDILNIENTQNP